MKWTNSGLQKRVLLGAAVAALAMSLQSAPGTHTASATKLSFADEELVAFVRPGLMITIESAQIASDGTISTVFKITDPRGVPLDREGIVTPGAVSTSFVAAYIPGESDTVRCIHDALGKRRCRRLNATGLLRLRGHLYSLG